ncbi:MAG TPA: signal protein PDZ, partial [Chloroflexota bacterium]|nr:signal protein PDZ [Chloroflexota bacterium]
MSTSTTGGVLASLSDELSNAIQRASQAVVTVDARRQLAASGILWPAGNGIVVTSDHVVERDED